jgi:tRNA threonylcarbamoyladenosine biosynthesis protein TsaE
MLLKLADTAATEALGESLAKGLTAACRKSPILVHLEGPLGAGKTTLVRGLLRGLGYRGRVRSPTFTLLEPYELAHCSVTHLDLYRLADPAELEYLGLADLFAAGNAVLVEWPQRGGDRLPPADVRVRLEYDGAARCAVCEGLTPAGQRVLAARHNGN